MCHSRALSPVRLLALGNEPDQPQPLRLCSLLRPTPHTASEARLAQCTRGASAGVGAIWYALPWLLRDSRLTRRVRRDFVARDRALTSGACESRSVALGDLT